MAEAIEKLVEVRVFALEEMPIASSYAVITEETAKVAESKLKLFSGKLNELSKVGKGVNDNLLDKTTRTITSIVNMYSKRLEEYNAKKKIAEDAKAKLRRSFEERKKVAAERHSEREKRIKANAAK